MLRLDFLWLFVVHIWYLCTIMKKHFTNMCQHESIKWLMALVLHAHRFLLMYLEVIVSILVSWSPLELYVSVTCYSILIRAINLIVNSNNTVKPWLIRVHTLTYIPSYISPTFILVHCIYHCYKTDQDVTFGCVLFELLHFEAYLLNIICSLVEHVHKLPIEKLKMFTRWTFLLFETDLSRSLNINAH